MTELDPQHRQLLDALRADEELPADRADAVLERLLAHGPPPAPGPAKLTLIKGGLVAVVLAGAALPLLLSGEAETPRPPPAAPAPVVAAMEPAAETTPAPPPAPKAAATEAPEQAPDRPARTGEAASRAPADGVAAEVALMGQIRRAIQNDEHARALRLLRRHARTFPDGVFADEREVSLAEALCASGDTTSGRRVAVSFVTERPDSPFTTRAQRACEPPAPPAVPTSTG